MAVVIDATPAGPSANSYPTLAEADTYHEALAAAVRKVQEKL